MATMRFSSLYLISEDEKAGISINFERNATVIQAGNGHGKSALIKSLYDTLGATPHRIDDEWKKANVSSLLKFEIEGELYSAFKYAGIYSIFDSNFKRLLQTSSISNDLAPFIARLLKFKLLMTGRNDNIVVPPPAYAFAPFYIDQDKSWNSAWEGFTKMYLSDGKRTLAEYHTGLKPNEYYEAKAARDQLKVEVKEEEVKRKGMAEALKELRGLNDSVGLYFDLDDFKRETTALLEESRNLYRIQSEHREAIAILYEQRALWDTQVSITKMALAETDSAFKTSIELPSAIECPTCGEGYDNGIMSRFNIAAESASLVGALKGAEQSSFKIGVEINSARQKLNSIEVSIEKISAILAHRENEISLGDVIDIQGRNSAARALRSQVDKFNLRIISINEKITEFDKEMRSTQNRERTKKIKEFFGAKLAANALLLDTRIGDVKDRRINSATYGRGSKGPRGLVAYYYAILETTKEFGSSTFCPIVIDAPNQQGQDNVHLPAIIKFLVNKRPAETQLILAVEDAQGIVSSKEDNITVINLASDRDQVLSKEKYVDISKIMAPYYAEML